MDGPCFKSGHSSTENPRNGSIRSKRPRWNILGWTVRPTYLLASPLHSCVFSDAGYIVDENDQIVAILAGRPTPDSWDDLSANIARTLDEAGEQTKVNNSTCRDDHRRGKFKALASGISFGNGQTVRPLFPFYFHSNTSP
jgi:hypothetical protein